MQEGTGDCCGDGVVVLVVFAGSAITVFEEAYGWVLGEESEEATGNFCPTFIRNGGLRAISSMGAYRSCAASLVWWIFEVGPSCRYVRVDELGDATQIQLMV